MRFSLILAAALTFSASFEADAQCCGQPAVAPTVAYSPVLPAQAPVAAATPVAPVTMQTTTVSDRWYPGKYLNRWTRSLFGIDRTTTYTAGYAPVAPTYSVGYGPAPSTYSAGYAPGYQVAYRPTYPASYGPVTYGAGYAPLAATQSVSRPVVLSPVVSAPACDACTSCGVVEQAGYAAAPSAGCSSCQPAASYPVQPATGYSDPGGFPAEPRPTLAPNENPPAERSIQSQRPEIDDAFGDEPFGTEPETEGESASTSDYWGAPPLFKPPTNRITNRVHPAPVRTAVYRRPTAARETAFRAPAPSNQLRRLSADGWASAAE